VDRLPEIIEAIQAAGKTAWITPNSVSFHQKDDMPLFDWYVQRNLNNKFSADKLNHLFFENVNYLRDSLNKKILRISKKYDIRFLDKTAFICDVSNETCDGVTPDGYKVFFDDHHWTLEGARHFGRRIHAIDWLGPLGDVR
jgi:hypothetical protein